ncbi:MAG TPA: sigma-70 family RNA polymerase sigma factor [Planctomycetota bacterium]
MSGQDDFLKRYLQAQPSVRAYVLSIVRDFHVTEDVLQEVAVAAWAKYATYDGARPFVAWVMGMAYYKCVDFLRARKVKPLLPDDLSQRLSEDAASLSEEAAERRKLLAACVEKLSAAVRSVFRLRFDLRLDAREIARRQGKSLAAVSKMLSRARAFLIRCAAGQPG